MNITKQFEGYAAAFERVFVDDNWSQLTQYFAINACYITRGATYTKAEGREALLSALRHNLSNFDRRFDKRDLITIEGPWVVGNRLTRKWQCCFTLEGVS
ncbi:MAG: hypothetical protein GXP16_00140, partial [Gammaproteobacteria bacterium]|nr:hypothetical protein [Gammaproteobacteria bacterium]